MTMSDWAAHLDRILTMSGEHLLQMETEVLLINKQLIKATSEYRKYKTRTLSDVRKVIWIRLKILEHKTDKC